MPPLEVAFTGFAIIGTTLLVLALTIAVYLFRQPRSASNWLLMGFFVAVALSGLATILTNGFVFWGPLFDPWQDAFVLLGGVSLGLFAYRFPRDDQPREARAVAIALAAIALLAVGYAALFGLQFAFAYTPGLDVNDAYYVLLPLGTLAIVAIFFRRAIHFSRLATAAGGTAQAPARSALWLGLHPQGEEARALTSFGLALSLGLVPGLAVLLPVPDPFGFLMLNIGSLLALGTLALVYFNYAPEMTSFMAKLVGITLLTLLIMLSVVATLSYRSAVATYEAALTDRLALTHASLLAGRANIQPEEVAYVAAWEEAQPDDAGAYRSLYARPDGAGLNLATLIAQNRAGALRDWSQPATGALPAMTGESWRRIKRYGAYPPGSSAPDFAGWQFVRGGTAYEIGLVDGEHARHVSALTIPWIIVIVASSLGVLLVFPFFFRRTLVDPLGRLLTGMSRVERGDLATTVPIQYRDEIGSLTESFNTLTRSLASSHDVLEQRVADRTRELSAFSDLTMLSTEENDLARMLEPALNRVLEAGKCHALAVHALSDDPRTLELIAHRNLPGEVAERMRTFALTGAFAARLAQAAPLSAERASAPNDLPAPLKIAGAWSYVGCPLIAGDATHGWLSCYREGGAPFSASETTFLLAIARQLGIMVEGHDLHQRIGQVAVVEERQRLARDLHDSVTQLLFSLTLFARAGAEAAADGDEERLNRSLGQVQATSVQALREMRSLLYELQPPSLEEKGLAQALAERVDVVERRVGIEVDYHADDAFQVRGDAERELYFVAIEALNNALKHAAATHVAVNLGRSNGHVEIRIADNGRGFDPRQETGGMGLQNMRDRVGRLGGSVKITTGVNEGTEVRILAPVAGDAP